MDKLKNSIFIVFLLSTVVAGSLCLPCLFHASMAQAAVVSTQNPVTNNCHPVVAPVEASSTASLNVSIPVSHGCTMLAMSDANAKIGVQPLQLLLANISAVSILSAPYVPVPTSNSETLLKPQALPPPTAERLLTVVKLE